MFICGGAGIGIELDFVRNRILSPVAGVAFSNRLSLSSANQSGINSLIAVGSITAPERICAPISPAFSSNRTRKSSFPASFASCLSRIAALSPAGPGKVISGACHGTRTSLPPPTIHTSTLSLSRSIDCGSKSSLTSANRRGIEIEKARC